MKTSKNIQSILRFFHPEKSGTNAPRDIHGNITGLGTHQREKLSRSKYYKVISNKVKNGVIQPHVGKW